MTPKRSLGLTCLCLTTVFGSLTPPNALGQDPCCFQPAYRMECETVLQPQPVTRMRLTYATEYVEEEVTSYRPVLRSRTEEREYRVAKPVVETNFREERYTVYKPVVETSYRDETVTQTEYVTETAEREEQVTTYRPVTETQMFQQQYQVQRPITETQMVQQQYVVQRPVVETQMQTEQITSYRPVTQMQNQTIDAGGYVPQQTVTPGSVQYGLAWNPAAYAVPGPFGIFARVRGAAVVAPQVTPPTVQTQMVYRPNYVTQQIAQTSYVPEVQQVQRPIQVTRMQSEMVTQNVPVQVQRMQTETITQNVPIQQTRMVAQTELRKIPYTVQRPVTRTSTRKVPVQQQSWVTEERVRKVPVQTTRMVYETRSEPVTVQFYEQEEIRRKVMRPVTVPRYEEYTTMGVVPQQVVQRLPLSYVDPFSPAIVNGFSSFPSSSSSVIPYSSSMIPMPSNDGVVRQPGNDRETRNRLSDDGESVLAPPANADPMTPQSRLGGIETGDLEPADDPAEQSPSNAIEDLFPESNATDSDDVGQPALNGVETSTPLRRTTRIREVDFRVQWHPVFAREA